MITSTKQTEEDNLYTDMIVGTHNNVKGLPKKGKKFAEKFLQENESFCRANALTELYIQAFGPDWTKEFDKNYKCIKLLTSKEGFEIPTPTKFEPVIPTIRFTEEIIPDINSLLPNEDILSENWFNTIGETDRTEEIPEF